MQQQITIADLFAKIGRQSVQIEALEAEVQRLTLLLERVSEATPAPLLDEDGRANHVRLDEERQ